MKKRALLVEPIKIYKTKWIVIYFSDFGDLGLDEANTIKEVNRLVRFHQKHSNAFEVYKV